MAGNGLGLLMIVAQSTFDYGSVWAATFLVTLVGMALYGAAVLIEAPLLRRWSPERVGTWIAIDNRSRSSSSGPGGRPGWDSWWLERRNKS